MSEPLLADTHIVVWYFQGSSRLAPRLVSRIAAALEGSRLFGATVSLREIAVLAARGRLRGFVDLGAWSRRTWALGFGWLPLDEAVALESARLAGEPPRDPFDQIIIASARVHGLTLVTADTAILEYARSGHLRVLAA